MTRDEIEQELADIDAVIAGAEGCYGEFMEMLGLFKEARSRYEDVIKDCQEQIRQATAQIADAKSELAEMVFNHAPDVTRSQMDRMIISLHQRHDQILRSLADFERAEAANKDIQDKICSECGKRPRHFDDLCKRCANAAGIRPKGKVGTA